MRYDCPLNERVRTMLRLEDLFQKFFHYLDGLHEYQHHSALFNLFQILDIVERIEPKLDVLQELDRQKIIMSGLLDNPHIAQKTLLEVLDDIQHVAATLRMDTMKLGQVLRSNEWLSSVRQRMGITGGCCGFDIPSYYYWLGLPHQQRYADLQMWIGALLPLYQAIRVLLRILRGSGTTVQLMALAGSYQRMLEGIKAPQLLCIELVESTDTCYFPEISANKYVININFNMLDKEEQKIQRSTQDISFKLTLCNL